jgi:hypothetical protein
VRGRAIFTYRTPRGDRRRRATQGVLQEPLLSLWNFQPRTNGRQDSFSRLFEGGASEGVTAPGSRRDKCQVALKPDQQVGKRTVRRAATLGLSHGLTNRRTGQPPADQSISSRRGLAGDRGSIFDNVSTPPAPVVLHATSDPGKRAQGRFTDPKMHSTCWLSARCRGPTPSDRPRPTPTPPSDPHAAGSSTSVAGLSGCRSSHLFGQRG